MISACTTRINTDAASVVTLLPGNRGSVEYMPRNPEVKESGRDSMVLFTNLSPGPQPSLGFSFHR